METQSQLVESGTPSRRNPNTPSSPTHSIVDQDEDEVFLKFKANLSQEFHSQPDAQKQLLEQQFTQKFSQMEKQLNYESVKNLKELEQQFQRILHNQTSELNRLRSQVNFSSSFIGKPQSSKASSFQD